MAASVSAPQLITRPVNDLERTVLRGNTHPLARAAFDRGVAPSSLPMQRMILVLQRSAAQEAALRTLLDSQQTKGSPTYHQWLTPQQFGQRFGPGDSDLEAVKAWLESRGFQVAGVSKGRTAIEFSGTAGQVQDAFHTQMHSYRVNGEQYWANASDPSIPSALAPAVKGVLSLYNFPRHAQSTIQGSAVPAGASGLPLYTYTQGKSTYYDLGPTDFASIYNVLPLWNAGIDGTGQTIAIVGDTDIHLSDIEAFRSLFGLAAKDPQIIVNGPDPGIAGDETEAVLDVSWSGAVAKNASIDLVVSATTASSLGVDLSALYIVDNNLAAVMSDSYGECEATLGAAGNDYLNNQLAVTINTPGTYTYTASYPGDAYYTGSQAPYSLTVTVQDTTFNITPPIPNMTIAAPGQTGTTAVALAAVGYFAGLVNVTCTLPAAMTEATCPATTAGLGNNTTASASLTITTTAPHSLAASRSGGNGLYGAGVLACALLLFLPGLRRKRIFLLLLVCVAGFAGCGGIVGSGGGSSSQDPGTPAGTYTVNVTASSSNITRTGSFTVTVQ